MSSYLSYIPESTTSDSTDRVSNASLNISGLLINGDISLILPIISDTFYVSKQPKLARFPKDVIAELAF
jgi:hypothetical protein